MTDAGNTTKPENTVKRAADFTSNVRTIIAAIVGIAVGIFFAGIYWSELQAKLEAAYNYGVTNTKEISVIKGDVAGLTQFRDDLKQWGKIAQPDRASGPGGGAGNPPTLCPEGTYMIGIETSSNTTGQCTGCLNGVRAVCRKLNTQ
jgi:hypothetical protein